MATFQDLELDWSMLCQECTECWSESDLQLAAELGKTLLERNKELENALKHHQNIIEDQTQEIEYLTKQTAALREVNDSRLRIYEQLEVSIQDLERANHRLALENAADKRHIKNLTGNVETLEQKCEELQGTIDDLRIQVDVLKRKSQQRNHANDDFERRTGVEVVRLRHVEDYGEDEVDECSGRKNAEHNKNVQCCSTNEHSQEVTSTTSEEKAKAQACENAEETDTSVEQMTQLLMQLRETRSQLTRDQRRITELEEQLATMVQQNHALENQIMQMHNKDEDMKSMHEELTTLEEVRQGQMCSRCLRNVDRSNDDFSLSLCDEPEDDDSSSIMDAICNNSSTQHHSSFTLDVQEYHGKTTSPNQNQSGNLYRDLVQKYEALLEIHRQPARANNKSHHLSLQEEMQQLSGDFNAMHTKDTDEESGHGDGVHKKMRKTLSHTPTDFSEAETSSSGFADETSNKGTQTEGRPGSFLCTIADGEDCRFSIYDDASPIDSRFRNRPEYRELFKEIFTVLKKAAENKDEGEELPLLDDNSPVKPIPKVPPVTPANDTLPDFPDNMTDDTQSVLSSTMSELSTSQVENALNTTLDESLPKPPPKQEEAAIAEPFKKIEAEEEQRVLTPLIRQPLEYISVGVNVRKRSSSRRKNRHVDRSDSPVTHIIGSPKITYASKGSGGRKSRDFKVAKGEGENVWNGNTLQFWSSRRNAPSPTPSQKSCFEYRPSTASQDLHKLKRLDLSYAEVLRNASNKNKSDRGRRK